MSVTGTAAIGVKGETGVFYDSEVLAIVHRFKTKNTGLVETSIWSWQGRRSQNGEREERKLKDMARHYGTKLCPVRQCCEPPELVNALGGRLAIRQVRVLALVKCLLPTDGWCFSGNTFALERGEHYHAPGPLHTGKCTHRRA